MASEQLLRELSDPDFGMLELWESRSWGGPIGGPTMEIVLLDWRGSLGPDGPMLIIDATDAEEEALAAFNERGRAVAKETHARQRAWLHAVAAHMLDTARDWAEQPALSVADLVATLTLREVTFDHADHLTLWVYETTGIFTDHVIVAQLDERGEVADVSLQG